MCSNGHDASVAARTMNAAVLPAAAGAHRRNARDSVVVMLAWLVVAVAAVHPPTETGFSICAVHAVTGVPCPGCGLIRSVACAARGMLARSWDYHPLGIALLAMCVVVAIWSVLPRRWRVGAIELRMRHSAAARTLTLLALAALIVLGAIRFVGFVHALIGHG